MKGVFFIKKLFSVFLILLVFSSTSMLPMRTFALPTPQNGTMQSAQTVYCLPGSGMTIGSVSNHESVQVYWKEGSYYYIQYVVSSGNYSGYKRGYVPVSSVSVSNVSNYSYSTFYAKVPSNKTVYNRSNTSSLVIGSVYSSDTFTVLQDDGSWYYIEYPISNGHKRGYIKKSDIIQPTGNLEAVSFSRIVGWAWDSVNPNSPILMHIYITNNSTGAYQIMPVYANIYRADLAQSGIGNGYHGFECSIDWTTFPTGTYTVRAYAIRGGNPQIGSSASYYTPYRYADYYFTARDWPNSVNTNTMSAINAVQSDYQSLGFVTYYTDSVTAETAANALQTNFITTLHGHGSAGQICLKVSATTTQWLHSTFTANGNDRSIKDIPANSMTQADIVAFLSCNSSVTPSGNNHKSLTQIVLDKGAKVSIGFSGNVIGAEYWYEYFVDGLTQGMNCADAYDYANYCAISDPACDNSASLSEIFRRCFI